MVKYPHALSSLILFLKKLPGVGKRTAERFAFHLLDWEPHDQAALAKLLKELRENINYCTTCGCILEKKQCTYCDTNQRDFQTLCVVSSPKEVFAIEETNAFRGTYHVFGPLLSPLEGKMPDPVKVEKLKQRIHEFHIKEIILAFDSTLEGDATALFLSKQMQGLSVKISRLALGMPMGSSLDFLDENTLAFAFKGRQPL